jgi:hypothetical protein
MVFIIKAVVVIDDQQSLLTWEVGFRCAVDLGGVGDGSG